MAKNIAEIIPIGKKNAIKRQMLLTLCKAEGLAKNDREMRRQIEQARKGNVVINLSNGAGYFIPDKSDIADLRHYIAQEKDRSLSILHNLEMAKSLLADMEKGRV